MNKLKHDGIEVKSGTNLYYSLVIGIKPVKVFERRSAYTS
jgi:biotin operon repressor